MDTRPLNLISLALDHARSEGAVAAEGYLSVWTGRRVECQGGRPSVFSDEGARLVGRVYVEGGGCGLFSVAGGNEAAITTAVTTAVDEAFSAPGNPHAGPAERYDYATTEIGRAHV